MENVFHRTKLISREMVAENTLALTIERPEGFLFEPGQNTMVSIPGVHADQLKEFTISSAPYEQHILLAMRVRNSKFKNACYALKPGDAIHVRTPSGSLWSPTDAPQIWLSGGIGITPFRGIIRHLIHENARIAITHMHSDHSRASVPFIREFESYSDEQGGYQFFSTMTREAGKGERKGRITGDMIAQLALRYSDSMCFVVGTESFVAAMRAELASIGVPTSQIRTERFEGYRNS
jgi:ferredoxin-NADP reductase